MSVMQVPRLIAPGFTLGAALSNRTQDRPCASFPVTTRRIGVTSSTIDPSLGRLRKLDELQPHCHPTCIIYHERPIGSASGAHRGEIKSCAEFTSPAGSSPSR